MKSRRDLTAWAVIVAAGKGTRMNSTVNKQYMEICGKPVLAWALQAFERCSAIEGVVLVVNPQDIVYCKAYVIDDFGFQKVKALVAGGDTRQASVYKGLQALGEECDIVAIHDGARPFVKEKYILESIRAAAELGAACTAVPVKDTIKTADDGFIAGTLDRDRLWAVQTPQTFKFELIMEAHRRASDEGFAGTDDAILVERLGHRIKLIPGGYENIKITTLEDLILAEALISAKLER